MTNNFTDVLDSYSIEYKEKEPLKYHTSFKIGGPCDYMVFPKSSEEIKTITNAVSAMGWPYLFLGNGSNVLPSDEGYRGVVIQLDGNFAGVRLVDDTTIFAEAGTSLFTLCRFALEQGLSGLEFAYGIPATVGGAVYMNAGAYGGEIKDVLQKAVYIDEAGEFCEKSIEELELSYRHSYFTGKHCCITGAYFSLTPAGREKIKHKMDDIYGRRKEKQPLDYPSAGSTFKRPEGAYAAALIEQCGLKGASVGGAQVSEKHSGFVINTGGATCHDVLALVEHIQETVRARTGFLLECEVKVI